MQPSTFLGEKGIVCIINIKKWCLCPAKCAQYDYFSKIEKMEESMKTLDPVSRLVVGAVLEDAVDQVL